jgi:hypothetical protein
VSSIFEFLYGIPTDVDDIVIRLRSELGDAMEGLGFVILGPSTADGIAGPQHRLVLLDRQTKVWPSQIARLSRLKRRPEDWSAYAEHYSLGSSRILVHRGDPGHMNVDANSFEIYESIDPDSLADALLFFTPDDLRTAIRIAGEPYLTRPHSVAPFVNEWSNFHQVIAEIQIGILDNRTSSVEALEIARALTAFRDSNLRQAEHTQRTEAIRGFWSEPARLRFLSQFHGGDEAVFLRWSAFLPTSPPVVAEAVVDRLGTLGIDLNHRDRIILLRGLRSHSAKGAQ